MKYRIVLLAGLSVLAIALLPTAGQASGPIQHVVIIYQENHSFDSVLGYYCKVSHPGRCDGATSGLQSDGSVRQLTDQPDIVPKVDHSGYIQATAIDGGKMDGWNQIGGCLPSSSPPFGCYTQEQRPYQEIPNLAKVADTYAISDRTFELNTIGSWQAHMELGAATLDGFATNPGNNVVPGTSGQTGPGWGCDSFLDAQWIGSGSVVQNVPACIPDQFGNGPYKPSPVQYVPTIFDRLEAAGLSWKIYGGNYNWEICPTFYECLSTQTSHVVKQSQFTADAKATLPALSILIPTGAQSQHNGQSMTTGDNYIGKMVNAVAKGPNWSSTAIFIAYDDCGCFYDHVAPPSTLGIRVPMVIVSPWARRGYTDSTTASFASMLAFVEHQFGLPALNQTDATAYDYAGAFNFNQTPLAPIHLSQHAVPRSSLVWLRAHPFEEDDTGT